MTQLQLNASEARPYEHSGGRPYDLTPPVSVERNYLLLVSAGLLALIAYVAMFTTAQAVWVSGTLDVDSGWTRLVLLTVPYVAGLLVFGYAYKSENRPAGYRLGLICGAIGLALLTLYFTFSYIWKLLAVIGPGALGGGDDSDSDGDSSSEASDSDSSDSSNGFTFHGSLSGSSGGSETVSFASCPLCGHPIPEKTGGRCPHCQYLQ
jgi:hypothetical protein